MDLLKSIFRDQAWGELPEFLTGETPKLGIPIPFFPGPAGKRQVHSGQTLSRIRFEGNPFLHFKLGAGHHPRVHLGQRGQTEEA